MNSPLISKDLEVLLNDTGESVPKSMQGLARLRYILSLKKAKLTTVKSKENLSQKSKGKSYLISRIKTEVGSIGKHRGVEPLRGCGVEALRGDDYKEIKRVSVLKGVIEPSRSYTAMVSIVPCGYRSPPSSTEAPCCTGGSGEFYTVSSGEVWRFLAGQWEHLCDARLEEGKSELGNWAKGVYRVAERGEFRAPILDRLDSRQPFFQPMDLLGQAGVFCTVGPFFVGMVQGEDGPKMIAVDLRDFSSKIMKLKDPIELFETKGKMAMVASFTLQALSTSTPQPPNASSLHPQTGNPVQHKKGSIFHPMNFNNHNFLPPVNIPLQTSSATQPLNSSDSSSKKKLTKPKSDSGARLPSEQSFDKQPSSSNIVRTPSMADHSLFHPGIKTAPKAAVSTHSLTNSQPLNPSPSHPQLVFQQDSLPVPLKNCMSEYLSSLNGYIWLFDPSYQPLNTSTSSPSSPSSLQPPSTPGRVSRLKPTGHGRFEPEPIRYSGPFPPFTSLKAFYLPSLHLIALIDTDPIYRGPFRSQIFSLDSFNFSRLSLPEPPMGGLWGVSSDRDSLILFGGLDHNGLVNNSLVRITLKSLVNSRY